MELAALIISILALICSVASLVWLGAKELSTHTVQLTPIESLIGEKGQGRPMESAFKEIGDELSTDELEYFQRQQANKTAKPHKAL